MGVFDRDVYYSYISTRSESAITPLVVGFERCRSNKAPIQSDKACFIIHYVLSGQGTIRLEGRSCRVSANNFFILPPHSNATYSPDKHDPWSYIWIEISGTAMRTVLDGTTMRHDNFVFSDAEGHPVEKLLKEMVEADNAAAENAEGLLVTGYVYRLLAFLLQNHPKEQMQTSSKKEETTKIISRYLTIHYNDPALSIQSVAERFGFSPSYLTRLFKEQIGITPIQFVDDVRMKKAIELLNHRTLTINQIAEAVGYSNQFYFARRFKRYFGMPPTLYKQKNLVDLDQ